MKKQLQGISLILFAAVLMLYALIDPWIPIISDIPTDLVAVCALVVGIVGLVWSFKKGN